MKISGFNIGEKKVFVIAEIGNNHNGSFELAKEMVDAAIDAGADCVKFQMRNMTSVYRKKSLAKEGEDLGELGARTPHQSRLISRKTALPRCKLVAYLLQVRAKEYIVYFLFVV